MASYALLPVTALPLTVGLTRPLRTDGASVPVEQAVDAAPEARKMPEGDGRSAPETSVKPDPNDAPMEKVLSDVRPVIERLDGTRDIAEVLAPEEADVDDRALQADFAYKAQSSVMNTAQETPEPVETPVQESAPDEA